MNEWMNIIENYVINKRLSSSSSFHMNSIRITIFWLNEKKIFYEHFYGFFCYLNGRIIFLFLLFLYAFWTKFFFWILIMFRFFPFNKNFFFVFFNVPILDIRLRYLFIELHRYFFLKWNEMWMNVFNVCSLPKRNNQEILPRKFPAG